MKKANWDWIYFTWMTLLPLFISIQSSYFVFQFAEIFNSQSFFSLLIVYLALAFAMGLAMIPTTLVSVLSGYLFGLESFPLVFFSYLFAALIGFLLGKLIQPTSIYKIIQKKKNLDLINGFIEMDPLKWIFLMRLSPVLPFALSNAYLSLLKIPIKSFLLASTFGMLPRTILAIWAGSEINYLREIAEGKTEANLQNYLSLCLLIISILGFYFLIKKKISEDSRSQ